MIYVIFASALYMFFVASIFRSYSTRAFIALKVIPFVLGFMLMGYGLNELGYVTLNF